MKDSKPFDAPQPGVDAVTGAYNMPAFAREMATKVIPARPPAAAMWYIDIRNFRSVNPKFGFSKGNAVLRGLVEGIRALLAHDWPVARLGADRIVFITAGIDFEHAQKAFSNLVEYVNDAAKQCGVNARLSLTAGLYYLREDDYTIADHNMALDYASIAHRNAKRESQSTVLMFSEEDLERDTRRITIEQTIDAALASGQIEVWYQPQIDYIFGDVIGAEALARWNHPELGWISPAEFVPVLENCGKIHDLDLYVWEEACRNAGRWRNVSDGSPVPISVNVSRSEMFEEGLMEHFLALQKKYNLPDGSLHLEITESAFVEEADKLYGIIEKMRANNMLVEMDDFGSGLSSLNMLKDVPVDVVKLDMGFMRSAVNEERGGVVLSSVIRMLQGLDTPIIAEGVETLEQAEMLKNMGCHLMQGFHFSRAMPLEEFEGYIASNNTVESSEKLKRRDSGLDELTSIDPSTSYLFNQVIGGTLFFFAGEGTSESILVNDDFYEECGLCRSDFGTAKINPIEEIDPASRSTLWRAAEEAREHGAAICRAKVRLTGRWIDCVMRYLGTSERGNIYSLNIFRSGILDGEDENAKLQSKQDSSFALALLAKIVQAGFFKCSMDSALTFNHVSPNFFKGSGLAEDEFMRRYHNSFVELVIPEDRSALMGAIHAAAQTHGLIDETFNMYCGFNGERPVRLYGRVESDKDGEQWLYGFTVMSDLDETDAAKGGNGADRIIPFDYDLRTDRLVVTIANPDGSTDEIVVENWLERVDSLPGSISPASASRILASVSDLKHHPASGFTDLKCNLTGGNELRWYHINYSCESDDQGNAIIVHGYAQDANDQMGSAKWWRRQAEIDHLTGLLNRNAVEQEINLAMHTHGAGMMFMIDLDAFKSVNDKLGHLAGDALLREVSSVLAEHFREGDLLGRYGGDEFVAFVPVMGGDADDLAANRSGEIIEAISSIEVTDNMNAGCSIGVAVAHDRDTTFYDLLEVADQAMYHSKLAGKGRYTLAHIS